MSEIIICYVNTGEISQKHRFLEIGRRTVLTVPANINVRKCSVAAPGFSKYRLKGSAMYLSL